MSLFRACRVGVVGTALAALLCTVMSIAPPICQAEPTAQASGLWAPLSFEDFVKRTASGKMIDLGAHDASWRQRSDSLLAKIKQSVVLSDQETDKVDNLVRLMELRRSGFPTRRVGSPLIYGTLSESRIRAELRAYYTARALLAFDTAVARRQIALIVGSSKADAIYKQMRDDGFDSQLSHGVYDYGGVYVPGLDRLSERWRYASYLAPSAAESDLRQAFIDARDEMQGPVMRITELIKRLDQLQAAPHWDERAAMDMLAQAVDAEVEMGYAAAKGEWAMLKILPEDYQGTWANTPPMTPIPAGKPSMAPKATPQSTEVGKLTTELR